MPDSDRRLSLILSFCFGVVFITALLTLAVLIPNPTATQFEIFRIVIAVAVAGVAAAIPGFLELHLSRNSNLAIRAGGALAVFVIVYFYSPARWVATEPPSISIGIYDESPAANPTRQRWEEPAKSTIPKPIKIEFVGVTGDTKLNHDTLPNDFKLDPPQLEDVISSLSKKLDAQGRKVHYTSKMDGGTLVIRPTIPYFDASKRDDLVPETQDAFFDFPPPVISVLLSNKNDYEIALAEVELKIEKSSIDIEPLVFFWSPRVNHRGNIVIRLGNLGWGDIIEPIADCWLESSNQPGIAISEKRNVVLKLPDGDNDTGLKAPPDLKSRSDKVYVVGNLGFKNEKKEPRNIRFRLRPLTERPGYFLTPTHVYNVGLDPDRGPYSLSRTISQIIPAKGTDHFLLSIYSPKSAYFALHLRFRTTENIEIVPPPIDIRIIRPRSSYYSMDGRPGRTWLGAEPLGDNSAVHPVDR